MALFTLPSCSPADFNAYPRQTHKLTPSSYMRRVAVYKEIQKREKEGDGSLAEFVDASKHL